MNNQFYIRRIYLTLGLLLLASGYAVAKPVILLEPAAKMVHMNPGSSAPSVTFSVKNVSGTPLSGFLVSSSSSTISNSVFSASLSNNTCTGTLLPNQSCQLTYNLFAKTTGKHTLPAEVCAFNGMLCSSGSLTVVSDQSSLTKPIAVIATNLLANVMRGQPYPIVASFFNADTQYPLTGVNITQQIPDFNVTGNTCQGVLNPQTSCQLSGTFTPQSTGTFHLTGTFHYNEGEAIIQSANTVSQAVAVAGNVVEGLPANVEKDRDYPVIFQYTNFGSTAATNTEVAPFLPLGTFTPTGNDCGTSATPRSSLGPGQSCQYAGTFHAAATGPVTLSTTLTGDGIVNPVTLNEQTQVTDVVIQGAVSPALPPTLVPGLGYPVVFTFTNTNGSLPATQLKLAKLLPNFTITSDTCGSSLAAGASCTVGGTFQPLIAGPAALSTVLTYGEHSVPLTLTTSSVATQTAVLGKLVEPLEANTEENTSKQFTFQYTNYGTADATNAYVTLNLPHTTNVSNNCGTSSSRITLASGASCEIKGTFENAPVGAVSLGATLNYTDAASQIQTVPLTMNTQVVDVAVTGTLTTALPVHTAMGSTYPFLFTFQNTNSGASATEIQVYKSLPHATGVVDNCGTSLAPSGMPGDSCTISGNFNSAYEGPQTLSATLLYKQGSSVVSTMPTMVTQISSVAANITNSTPYTSPNMSQYSLDGTKRAGFVVLPSLQTTTVSGAPAGLTWHSAAPSNFNVQLTRTQDSQSYNVNFNGQRSNACGNYSMNSAVACSSPGVGVFRLSSGNNAALPAGTYTGELFVSMQDWFSAYRYILKLNITYTKT